MNQYALSVKACSALRSFAEEIIFMAPVIFWEDWTEPILPFNSRIVDIADYFLNRFTTSSAVFCKRVSTSGVSLPSRKGVRISLS